MDPSIFAQFHATPRSETWAATALRNTMDSIVYAKALGIEAKVNTTIVDESSEWRPIYEYCKAQNVPFRIQNELSSPAAVDAIKTMIGAVNGQLLKVIRKGPTSRISYEYADADGYRFRVKLIAPASLSHLCGNCEMRRFCTEGFYTIRLEPNEQAGFNIRLCIHRNDPGSVCSPQEFLTSRVFDEIKRAYAEQYGHVIIQ
jgi:hypothetical protein